MRLLFAGPASLLALAVTLAAIPAQAAYTVTFSEVGSDVVAIGSGSIDLAGLSLITSGATVPQVAPTFATEATGAAGAVEEYGGASGPTAWGGGVFTGATTGTGDLVGIQQLIGEPTGFVFVPPGYASKASSSDMATYAGQSFATLGFTPGVYLYTFGAGADADTFTVDVGAPVPEPASLTLLAAAGLGLLARRRRPAQPSSVKNRPSLPISQEGRPLGTTPRAVEPVYVAGRRPAPVATSACCRPP